MRQLMLGVLVLMVCGPIQAQDFNLPRGKWWQNEMLVQRLNLTSEQQEQIHSLVVEHARRMIDLTANVKRTELDLRELADSPSFDANQVRQAHSRFQQAKLKLDTERFELLLAIRQLLTTEQWQELNTMRKERAERRPNRFPNQRGQRPPGAPQRSNRR